MTMHNNGTEPRREGSVLLTEDVMVRSPQAAITGCALVGAALGYLCWTPQGRRLHELLDDSLDQVITELRRLRVTTATIRAAVEEGRHVWLTIDTDRPQPT